MPPSDSPVRLQVGFRGWAAIAVGVAVLGALVFVAIGLFVFFLPLLLLAPLLYWLLPRPKIIRVNPAPGRETDIIEGEFEVVDDREAKKRLEP